MSIDWKDDYESALATARRQGRLLVVHFWLEGRPLYRAMNDETFKHPEVVALSNARFVNVKVDLGARPELFDRLLGGRVELAIVGDALFERARADGLLQSATPDKPLPVDPSLYKTFAGSGSVYVDGRNLGTNPQTGQVVVFLSGDQPSATYAFAGFQSPKWNSRVCCPLSISTFSVVSSCQVMCSRAGTRMIAGAP